MKKLVINLTLAGVIGSFLVGCNQDSASSAQSTPTLSYDNVQSLQAEVLATEQTPSEQNMTSIPSISRVSVGHSVELAEIDTWWEVKQAEAKADDYLAKGKVNLFIALEQGKFGTYLGSQSKDLLMSGLSAGGMYLVGVLQQSIMKAIFPGYPGKSIEEIRFDTIMDKLGAIDDKLSEVKVIGQDTFSTLVSNNMDLQQNKYASILANIQNSQADVAVALSSVKRSSGSFGADFISGKFDFMTEVDGKMVTNESAVKLIMYLADQKNSRGQTVFTSIFSADNAGSLEQYAQELSNLSSANAYAVLVNKMINSNAPVENFNLLPNIMSALASKVYDNYSSAWTQTTNKKYEYSKTQYGVVHLHNQLSSYIAFDSLLQAMDIDVMKNLALIEKIQYMSLILYYIGGDKSITIPNIIKTALFIDDKNADDAEKNGAPNASDLRRKTFEDAAKMLSDSYERRASHVSQLLFDPKVTTYGKFMFKSVSPVGSGQVFSPSWDLIRGSGIYANESANVIHPVQPESNDSTVYYNTDKNGNRLKKSIIKLILDDDIYWDGSYLRTPELSSTKELLLNKPLMQKIGSICHTDTGGVYQLELVNDLLYCSIVTSNLGLINVGKMLDSRQAAYIDFLADNKWNSLLDKNGVTLGVKGNYFYTSDGKLRNKTSTTYSSTSDRWAAKYSSNNGPDVLYNYTNYSNANRLYLSMPDLNSALIGVEVSSNITHRAYFPIKTGYGLYFLVVNPSGVGTAVGVSTLQGDFNISKTKEISLHNNQHMSLFYNEAAKPGVMSFNKTKIDINSKFGRYFVFGYNPGSRIVEFVKK